MPTVAPILDIRDAVVAELNAPQDSVVWDQTFEAAAKYVVRMDRKDVTGWVVSVVPSNETDEPGERSGKQYRSLDIDIGIQTRVNPDTVTEGDALLSLAEQVMQYWLTPPRRPVDYPDVICSKVTKTALFIPEQMDKMRVGTAVLTLTFEGLI